MDLVGHEADWRGGLRWMADHYPAVFDPPNPRVHEMAGCGAYSGDERPVDVAKFKADGVPHQLEALRRFPLHGHVHPAGQERRRALEPLVRRAARPPASRDTTSCRQMNDYARWMRRHGFHVLNYFNVTEFGKNMHDAAVRPRRPSDPQLWKDPVAFLKLQLPDAYLRPPIVTCYNAWVIDLGDPAYREFMLDQAERHIALVPDTDGICIDRIDWLRLDNPAADDGVSWVDGRPARSLYRSWIAFMDELGPLMHRADKVIFANTMTMRLELARQLDGIYNEFGKNGRCAEPDRPDGHSQAGAGLDHQRVTSTSPTPTPFIPAPPVPGRVPDGPLSVQPPLHHARARGRDASTSITVRCSTPSAASGGCWRPVASKPDAGCRRESVRGARRLWLPVTFGGKTTSARIRVGNVPAGSPGLKCDALHPGLFSSGRRSTRLSETACWKLQVPLNRGLRPGPAEVGTDHVIKVRFDRDAEAT